MGDWLSIDGSDGKKSACKGDPSLIPGLGRSLGEGMATHSSILAEEFHGQRSLAGDSSWGPKDLEMIEWLTLSLSLSSLSCVWLFVTPWTVARQGLLSTEFSKQKYWSGLPFPSPRDLPDPGIRLGSPAFQADSLTSKPPAGSQYSILWQIHVIGFYVVLTSRVLG